MAHPHVVAKPPLARFRSKLRPFVYEYWRDMQVETRHLIPFTFALQNVCFARSFPGQLNFIRLSCRTEHAGKHQYGITGRYHIEVSTILMKRFYRTEIYIPRTPRYSIFQFYLKLL
jgi:hypothetical protein